MLKVRQYLSRLLVILLLVNLFPLGVYAIGYKTKLYNYCYTPDQQKITPISSETIGTGVSVIKTIINPCTKIDEGITLTITKPQDINDDTNGKVYECVGVIICGNLNINGSDDVDISQISESKYIKFESNVEQKYEVQAEDIVTATTKDFSFLALWKESERKNPVVTYNVNGNAPEGASIFPIIKNFRNQDNGSIDNPEGIWSLGFFSVPSQDNNLRMKDTRETVDITNLTQSCTLGGSITIPSFEQKRAPQFGTERYYPVIGFVAREKDTSGSYQYYKMIGWKDDQGKIYKEGDQYSPTSNVTLNGEWEKINLPDDPNKDLPVPLLKEQTETGTFVKLQQKTTGGEYHSGTTATSTDGLIDYRVVMQFSDVFSAGEMPWMGGTHYYFKTVDNSDFVDSKLKITLDDHVAPVTDADGYTTITIKNASIKVTGIEETTDEEITKNDLSETIRVKLGNMKSFTIDFDWDSYNQNEMTVEIPTKVVDGYIGDITGTKANFSGSLNFDKAHSETSARLPGADFEPDQFVRYVLCLDEKWNSAYGGENMTIEDMLLAAKHIENDLKNINIDSNPVTASASQAVTSLTVDPTSVTVNVGKTQNVYVTILPETVTNKSVTWTSENPSIASVDPNTGTITGITPGSTTITATSVYDTSKSAKVEVTVKGQVKTQVITGGTITVEPEYAAAGETVTLTVKPDADYELIEGTVTGSYSKTIEGKEAEIGNITIAKSAEAEEGTYTFVMPAASPINISAAFLDANNKTVVDPPKTEIKSANGSNSAIQNFVNQYGNIMNVELSEKASEELMQSVTVDNEADDVDYSETQAQKLLSGKVQAGNDIYRHLQTKTDVEVKYYYENGNGAGEMRLDISFKYRVVASTTAKPAEVNFDDNAKVMSKGPNDNKETPESDKGWVEYESKEDTYITVPIPKAFSPDGDWVKIEHEHDGLHISYAKIENGEIQFTNQHSFSIFTLTTSSGLNDIILGDYENAGGIGFEPDKKNYEVKLPEDTQAITLTPVYASVIHGDKNAVVKLNGTVLEYTTGDQGEQIFQLSLNAGENTVIVEYGDFTYTIKITCEQSSKPDSDVDSGGGSSGSGSSLSNIDVSTADKTENGSTTTETTARPSSSVSDGKAKVKVTQQMGNEMVKQAQENKSETVVVAPKINGDVTSTEVSIPSSTVKGISEKTKADLRVETPAGDVTIPNSALSGLAGKQTGLVVTTSREDNDVQVEVTVDGRHIGTVKGGIKLETGYDNCGPNSVAVLVGEDGTRTVIRNSVGFADSDTMVVPLDGSARIEIIENPKTFIDLENGAWYKDAVDFAGSHELMQGVGNQIFSPDVTTTRGMVVTLLYNLEGNPEAGENLFADVATGTWFNDAITWASENDIVTGYDANTFGPDDTITREQMAVILYRYAQFKGHKVSATATLDKFTDASSVSSWAVDAVKWATDVGLMEGMGNNLLEPAGSATRAQIAAILMRYLEYMVK